MGNGFRKLSLSTLLALRVTRANGLKFELLTASFFAHFSLQHSRYYGEESGRITHLINAPACSTFVRSHYGAASPLNGQPRQHRKALMIFRVAGLVFPLSTRD